VNDSNQRVLEPHGLDVLSRGWPRAGKLERKREWSITIDSYVDDVLRACRSRRLSTADTALASRKTDCARASTSTRKPHSF
jgi:hypothetical protein